MQRGVFLDLDGVREEMVDRIDLQSALVNLGGAGQMRRLGRNGLVAREGHENVLVAREALAGEAMARRDVVDFRFLDLVLGDLAELAQGFLFLFRQRGAIGPLVAEDG